MTTEIVEEIWEMLERDYTDDQIVGELLRLYPAIETSETLAALEEALGEWFIHVCPF